MSLRLASANRTASPLPYLHGLACAAVEKPRSTLRVHVVSAYLDPVRPPRLVLCCCICWPSVSTKANQSVSWCPPLICVSSSTALTPHVCPPQSGWSIPSTPPWTRWRPSWSPEPVTSSTHPYLGLK